MAANRPGLGTPLPSQDRCEAVRRAGTCSETGIVRASPPWRPLSMDLDRRTGHDVEATSTVIEVFADIWCPFTYIGLKLVAEQLQVRGRRHVRIWVRSWPLEWVNGRGLDPKTALHHARELREQVSPQLFSGLDASRFPHTTPPVLALVAKGYKEGLEVGEPLSFEVRDSLFEHGRDVADPDVLAEIAESFELNAPGPHEYATVVNEWKEGRNRGVRGSPHFFGGGQSVFCPGSDISQEARS